MRGDADVERELKAALADTVRASSSAQSIKGIFTAGLQRAVRYAAEKVKKKLGAGKS